MNEYKMFDLRISNRAKTIFNNFRPQLDPADRGLCHSHLDSINADNKIVETENIQFLTTI